MEFVICDDEKLFRNETKKVIDKIYIRNDDYYHINEFEKFDKNFEKMIKDGKSKIYILDIEIKNSISGIDIARMIRKYDWESIIIMVTSHTELGYEALKAQIMLLDFISKYDECNIKIEKTIKKAINQVNNKKTIKFETEGVSYIVHLDDIIYIERDTTDRKCIIKTTYNNISINKSLNYMISQLDERFYLSHRSCIINTNKIREVNWNKNVISFYNGVQTNLLAREKKRGLKDYVSS